MNRKQFFQIIGCFLGLSLTSFVVAKTHHPQRFLEEIKGDPHEGKKIVEHFCSTCHASKPLIPLGAPRIQNKQDWQPRLQGGVRSLIQHTEEGYGAMPARGGCFECSDEQLLQAIVEMLPASFTKDFLFKAK